MFAKGKINRLAVAVLMVVMAGYIYTSIPVVEAADTAEVYVVKHTEGNSLGKYDYSYDQNGMIVKKKNLESGDSFLQKLETRKYKNGLMTESYNVWPSMKKGKQDVAVVKYSYDKRERAASYTSNYVSYFSSGKSVSDVEGAYYYNKKNQLIRVVMDRKTSDGKTEKYIYKYKYNKKGLPTEVNKNGRITRYEYDEYGNMSRYIDDGKPCEVTNTYDQNGCLTEYKQSLTLYGTHFDGYLTYEMIEVPAKYLDEVERQQWDIINGVYNVML